MHIMKKDDDTITENLIKKVKALKIITPKNSNSATYLNGQLSGKIPVAYYKMD